MSVEPTARPMRLSEIDVIIDYFHGASREFLHGLGVDPAKLPPRDVWRARYEQDLARPIEQRRSVLILWEAEGAPVGFSTADRIVIGREAYMHLHILDAGSRRRGWGAALVRQTAQIYFEMLQVAELYAEPYALNVAPNRTLQRAGFKYVMTHETVPGLLNFHQPVNRWVLKRSA